MHAWKAIVVVAHIRFALGDFWAVLVAGSRGMANYRHQADVCHTYHLLTESMSVDPAQVVTMMYDDVAWSSLNPLVGRLFNAPDGENVYQSCRVDYRRSRVSISTFLNTLKNTVKSGENSTVFLSFVDHGEPGSLLLPNGEHLTGETILAALNSLQGRYKRVLIYVEACFAGSVFENIELPENVIAVTAANATESSWGTFCPTPQHPGADEINGIHIGTCLGDLFEVSWKRDLETRTDWATATLGDHISAVQSLVARKSHVMVYGDRRLLDTRLADVFPPVAMKTNGFISEDLLVESAVPQRAVAAAPEIEHDRTIIAS